MTHNMAWIVRYLWLIPALPMLAAGVSALLKQSQRRLSSALAIGSMSVSLILSLIAFAHALSSPAREYLNFPWLQFGQQWVSLGWLLDPLAAVMLVMVSFVSLLIFIYSTGYMAHDVNFTRFFTFLALFGGAMLGVVIANSLLLLFMCWEVVGLTSYLLIGFWFQRPSAAAAAVKAFITTRVGDLGLLLGMVWLYSQTGTLLFYNNGAGCLEHTAVAAMAAHLTIAGMAVSTAISLLIFCGAVGKSGQVPLHVWLPDAMEGPTPVSALIHAATMVAAGVYLMARVYPLLSPTALEVIAWVGAITAFFAACIAVAQNDIKRILAYSTVSQLGYMMLGLGVGGVAVGMFHLITHAFFKSLLFLSAGSVIHGCHEEQDVRHMGGLRKAMPITFGIYAIATLALCGFPIFFSGFWSKDAIIDASQTWSVSAVPYYLLLFGAVLTAFYMTRQVSYVFFGQWRGHKSAHESGKIMLVPMATLAFFCVALGIIGTPAWPWFHAFLSNQAARANLGAFASSGFLLMLLSATVVVFAGIGFGWWLYGNKSPAATEPDALEKASPWIWAPLRDRLYVDEFYDVTVIAFYRIWARVADWLDRFVWGGIVAGVALSFRGLAHLDRLFDMYWIDGGFDKGCEELTTGGGLLARVQTGRVQTYLRLLALAFVVLVAILIWSSRA